MSSCLGEKSTKNVMLHSDIYLLSIFLGSSLSLNADFVMKFHCAFNEPTQYLLLVTAPP